MQIHELPSGTPTDSDLLPFDTGSVNYKTPFSGFDVGENTATFTSADEADPAQFKTVDPIESGPIKTILNRLSMAVSNIRYIWKIIGTTVMGTTADTVTGAISEINTKLTPTGAAITSTHTINSDLTSLTKTGNVCMMTLGLTLTSNVAAYDVIATIPSGFRPRRQCWGRTAGDLGFDVTIGGNIRLTQAATSGTVTYMSMTYIIS